MGAQPLTRPAGSPLATGATNPATTGLARTSRKRAWKISPVIAVCMAFLVLLSMRNRPPA